VRQGQISDYRIVDGRANDTTRHEISEGLAAGAGFMTAFHHIRYHSEAMARSPYKLLRLARGKRYVVAVQHPNGEIDPHPYWDETQALSARRTPVEQWKHVPTEVFTQVFTASMPQGYAAFMRKQRRNTCFGVVLWHGSALYPLVFPTLDEAVAAALRDVTVADEREDDTSGMPEQVIQVVKLQAAAAG
jgi:hypothetical protein